MLQTPPEGHLDEAELVNRRSERLTDHEAGGNDTKGGEGRSTFNPTRTTDPGLLARLAAMEDRLDRHSMAFGALCELVCEPLGITEADLARSIRQIAAEY